MSGAPETFPVWVHDGNVIFQIPESGGVPFSVMVTPDSARALGWSLIERAMQADRAKYGL